MSSISTSFRSSQQYLCWDWKLYYANYFSIWWLPVFKITVCLGFGNFLFTMSFIVDKTKPLLLKVIGELMVPMFVQERILFAVILFKFYIGIWGKKRLCGINTVLKYVLNMSLHAANDWLQFFRGNQDQTYLVLHSGGRAGRKSQSS